MFEMHSRVTEFFISELCRRQIIMYAALKLYVKLGKFSWSLKTSPGNAIITRRKDKQRFILCWQSIHERCFQIRKEERWLEMRRKIREEAERNKEA